MFLVLNLFAAIVFAQEKGSFTDSRDGKVYKTVKIDTQWWMAENLAYKASNGCWAYGNDNSSVSKYGYLYNWGTAKKVCPTNWHLPNNAEWTTLIASLGGYEVAGKKMKSATGWDLKEGVNYGNNESGFNALPGGYRDYHNGSFYSAGTIVIWWSSTPLELHADRAWVRTIGHDDGGVYESNGSLNSGHSVRCIKD